MSNKFNTAWFKNQMSKVNLSQRKLADKLNLNVATLNQMLLGKRKLKLEEVARLASILMVSESEILENSGLQATTVQAFKGTNDLEICGFIDSSLNVHYSYASKNDLKGPKNAPNPLTLSTLHVLRCQFLDGGFESFDGALIYFQKSDEFNPDSLGRLSIVEFFDEKQNGQISIKLASIKRGYATGRYHLADLSNKIIQNDVEVKSSSIVKWMHF